MAKPNKKAPKKAEVKAAIQSFMGVFMVIGVFSMVINLLMLVSPMYMMQIYDRVLGSRNLGTLLALTIIVVWLLTIMGFLEFIRARILVRLGARLDERLSSRVYSVMMQLSLNQPGQASSQPVNDLGVIRQFATGTGIFAFFDAPWIPVFLTVLWIFHPLLGIFAISAGVVLMVIALINEVSTRKLLLEANEEEVVSAHAMNAELRNAEVVRAMGMEDALRDQWLHRQLHSLRTQGKVADRNAIWLNLSKVLRLLFQSLMLGLGAYLAITEPENFSAGMIIAANILMSRALGPIDQMIGTWRQYKSARVSFDRLNELLEKFPDDDRKISLPQPEGHLELQDVTVVPPGAKQSSVHGVSFKLRAAESLIVMGPSAAGKSSLLRAILGVWPLVQGKVRLDSSDITQWNRDELGQYIGYLPQGVELFEGTVAQNIARFTQASSEEVIAAAKLARVDQMIRRLPEGYNTQIGAGGSNLSGGQRQRVGLARAVFGNPRLVVLDEPNANLDEAGEQLLLQCCADLKRRGVTLIMVSHRRDVLQIADKVLILNNGAIGVFGERDQVIQHMLKQQQQQKAALEQRKQAVSGQGNQQEQPAPASDVVAASNEKPDVKPVAQRPVTEPDENSSDAGDHGPDEVGRQNGEPKS